MGAIIAELWERPDLSSNFLDLAKKHRLRPCVLALGRGRSLSKIKRYGLTVDGTHSGVARA
jgi:hypothetical protein